MATLQIVTFCVRKHTSILSANGRLYYVRIDIKDPLTSQSQFYCAQEEHSSIFTQENPVHRVRPSRTYTLGTQGILSCDLRIAAFTTSQDPEMSSSRIQSSEADD